MVVRGGFNGAGRMVCGGRSRFGFRSCGGYLLQSSELWGFQFLVGKITQFSLNLISVEIPETPCESDAECPYYSPSLYARCIDGFCTLFLS
ncbi:Nodule Cysteine-Rich (NCR) secreted peptide [Medicago truncatula]|uniref:Nodule Cysteine-Rich (NCR) secreted peptide n=1 Tax=Medicago truncatula TaxID=3880 RepID=G7JQH7_MEDTR|nr:Nodule Cysteine-Rich (NCR) secreted peptide [Medicago truncatula]